jgi:hypothetical protein
MTRFHQYIKTVLLRNLNENSNFLDYTEHPQLVLEILEKYQDKDWNWFGLQRNKNFTFEWIRKFPDKDWNWRGISRGSNFDLSIVREFPTKNWDWRAISRILTNNEIFEFKDFPLDWTFLTLSEDCHTDYMILASHLPWTIHELFFKDIKESEIDFLRFYRDRYNDYDWEDHTMHASWNIIKRNMDLPWVKRLITITNYEEGDIDIIRAHPGDWNISSVIPVDVILENMTITHWDFYYGVSMNPTLKSEHVEKFPTLDWNFSIVPINPKINEWFAANIIKKHWKRAVTDPERKLCQKIFLEKMINLSIEIKSTAH